MKYIRTNDGISKLDDDWALFCKEHASNNQADTMEELCDEFVLVGENGIPYGTHELISNEEKQDKNKLITYANWWDYGLYGAIWTDKGLIYVAKMNDKGELELL